MHLDLFAGLMGLQAQSQQDVQDVQGLVLPPVSDAQHADKQTGIGT